MGTTYLPCSCPEDCGKTVSTKNAKSYVKMHADCAKSYHRFNLVDQTIVCPKTKRVVNFVVYYQRGHLRLILRVQPDMVKWNEDDDVPYTSDWISGEVLEEEGIISGMPSPFLIHPDAYACLSSSCKNSKKSHKTTKEKRSIDSEYDEHVRNRLNTVKRNRREATRGVPSFTSSDQDEDVVAEMSAALLKILHTHPKLFGAYWFTCQYGQDILGNIIARWQEDTRFMKKSNATPPLLDAITRDPFTARDMATPDEHRGSKPVVISCVYLKPCESASQARHYEMVGVKTTNDLAKQNLGRLINLNQDNGGTGSCKDDAPAFGLCIFHNLGEVLQKSTGGFNTACSIENRNGWKKTCDERKEGLYREVHSVNESKKTSYSRTHVPGQMKMSGDKLEDMRYYSASNYSKAGVKRNVSPKEVSSVAMSQHKAPFKHEPAAQQYTDDDDLPSPPESKKQASTKVLQKRWVCDVCKVKWFLDYNEACEHERQCEVVSANEPEGSNSVSSIDHGEEDSDCSVTCKPAGKPASKKRKVILEDSDEDL